MHQFQGRFQLLGILLEPLLIDGVTTGQMLFQGAAGPLPEQDCTAGVNPVTHRDNGIEVKELNMVGFPITGSCCIFCNN